MIRTKYAYAAGIVDGEGTISVQCTNERTSLSVLVRVTNTDKSLIRWLHSTFRVGHVYTYAPRSQSPKRQWVWVVNGTQVYPLLKKLLPHLKVKRKLATLILSRERLRDKRKLNILLCKVRRINGYSVRRLR